MMRATICPAIALFLFFFSAGMELKADTVISAGLVGTGGMTDLAGSADSGEWKRGFNAGGGLAMGDG